MRESVEVLGGPEDVLDARSISLEEAFSRQNDRIAYLRSVGASWSEAVFQLRDFLVGVEDDEFWDGMPKHIRDRVAGMAPHEAAKLRALWAPHGWHGFPCQAFPGPDGDPVYWPTPSELSRAYSIVLKLAARLGITWRTKRRGYLGLPEENGEA
jgi:hypothetical protein